MIVVDKENNITISHGDTLAIEFELSEPLEDGDEAIFSIKKENNVLLNASFLGAGCINISYVISKDDMAKLGIGKFVYDLHINYSNGVRFTSEFTRRLEIVKVAHEV